MHDADPDVYPFDDWGAPTGKKVSIETAIQIIIKLMFLMKSLGSSIGKLFRTEILLMNIVSLRPFPSSWSRRPIRRYPPYPE